jgi:hypothetical protein
MFVRESVNLKNAFQIAALLWLVAFIDASIAMASQDSQPTRGDRIFKPTIAPVASIDKTGRPMTVKVTQPEPSFSHLRVTGKATGDNGRQLLA